MGLILPHGVKKLETILHCHGGELTSGDKSDIAPVASEIASHYVAFVNLLYFFTYYIYFIYTFSYLFLTLERLKFIIVLYGV